MLRNPNGLCPKQHLSGSVLVLLAVVTALGGIGRTTHAAEVSFRNDVTAVLSKAGCNQGTCHGNQNGKNGFKLSLRGEDPAYDLAALVRDMGGRRANPLEPDRSLLLTKPTGQVAHEGGKRFDTGSREYEILREWIAAGMRPDGPDVARLRSLEVTPQREVLVAPAGEVQLEVRAAFSDGSTRDVTGLACYETSNQVVTVDTGGKVQRQQDGETAVIVRYLDRQETVQLAFVPARPEFQWHDVAQNNFIDGHVFAKLRTLRMQPSELSSDGVFLRRAYLDAVGMLPTVEESRRFLADEQADKRRRLIDALLERPEFADFWALKWSDLLRNEEKTLDRKGVQGLHHWLRRNIAEGMPLNRMAAQLLAARGSTYRNPPANFYRAHRDPNVTAETVAQVFLGVRIGCASCHNHPFDRWTQNDYYSLAGFFARVRYKVLENNRRDQLDAHEFDGEQVVWMDRSGEVNNPRTGSPALPRFLGADDAVPASDDRLEALAGWIADPYNPFFAKVQANRIWYHLLGRGIVDPIDDFRSTNPPVNEPLLEALTKEFIDHDFDLRHMVRTIMNSRTYQLSAAPNETNSEDAINFSHALVRPLQAEQLLDALAQVTAAPVKFNGYPLGLRAGQLPGVRAYRKRDRAATQGEEFLTLFGKPDRLLACECERSEDTTLAQTFQLISGPLVNELLANQANRIGKCVASGGSNAAIIEELYLAALSRKPAGAELENTLSYVGRCSDRRAALEDIAWGLLNAKEFLLRR